MCGIIYFDWLFQSIKYLGININTKVILIDIERQCFSIHILYTVKIIFFDIILQDPPKNSTDL